MVMEGPPSPSSVGREFVRQYYTLLNKAPAHLHRFYNNQSSFVHGGLDPPHRETLPMIGQKQIHQKIQQLNFQDCHAKITQVDAQATLGNGVVVQVTGELSNAGQPMRRFTQTFVLAAQSPKKYYVHNDIFRYQDEIISDEECEGEARSSDEGDMQPDLQPMANYYQPQQPPPQQQQQPVPVQQQQQQHHQQQQQQQPQHHVMQQAVVQQQQVAPPQQVLPPPQQQQQQVMQQQQPAVVPPPTVNGAVHQEELMAAGIPQQQQQQQHSMPPMAVELEQVAVAVAVAPPVVVEELQAVVVEEGAGDASEVGKYMEPQVVSKPVEEVLMNSEPVSNEPKTYANLLKSSSAPYAVAGGNIYAQSQPPKSVSPPPMKMEQRDRDNQFNAVNRERNHRDQRGDQRNNGRLGGSGGPQGGAAMRPGGRGPGADMRAQVPRDSNPVDGGSGGGGGYQPFNDDGAGGKPMKFGEDRRRSQGAFADANQLFLGNLPLWASEDDLRDVFEKYGPIADLRILSKPNKPGVPGGRAPPNYGFITYETPAGVQACLESKPIYLQDKSGGGSATILNVEEKKVKERGSYPNMRNQQGDNLSPRQPRDNNGPRRGGPIGGGGGGQPRQPGGGPMGGGGGGGGGQRPNSFNRGGGTANRGGGGGGPPNTYARR